MGIITFYSMLGIMGILSLIILIRIGFSIHRQVMDLKKFRKRLSPGDVIRVSGKSGIHIMYKNLHNGKIVIRENGADRFPTVRIDDIYPVPEPEIHWEITTDHD
jgi:hypothetical protein